MFTADTFQLRLLREKVQFSGIKLVQKLFFYLFTFYCNSFIKILYHLLYQEITINGLFTHMEMDTGSDPYPEWFPLDWSVTTVVPRNIHTVRTWGQIPIPKRLL